MDDEDQLSDLLLQWEEFHEKGEDVPPEELCRDCPELVQALAARILALKKVGWVKKSPEVHRTIPYKHVLANAMPSPPGDKLPQETLADTYRLDELIAEGGFGWVWRAFDLDLQRPVAVKVPKLERLADPEGFLTEARKVANLDHPGIVPVYRVDRHKGAAFIVSKLIDGVNLGERLRKNAPSVREAVRIVAEVACALDYAHKQGFVHRDIKPANILVDNQGQVFITDFGIAVTEGELRQGTDGSGTPAYMSPEQVGNHNEIDRRTDIYSLGVVLYELLTGQRPFQADTRNSPPSPRSVNRAVPRNVERICLKCLEKSPANRYPTAQALADDLSRCLRQRSKGVSIGVIGLLGVVLLIGLSNSLGHSTSKGEMGDIAEVSETLPPDLSQDISGTWSGSCEESDRFTGPSVLAVNEQPNGTIVGWSCKDYKIEEGRRVGRDEIRYLCSGKGYSFQVIGKIKDRGRTLLLLYSGTSAGKRKAGAVLGVEKLTRDGVGPYSDPKPEGWSGRWLGMYANSFGKIDEESIVLKDTQDGTVSGAWDGGLPFTGRKKNDGWVHWEQVQPHFQYRLYKAEVRLDGDVLRTTYTIAYPPGNPTSGFTGDEWFIRDNPTQHGAEQSKLADKQEPTPMPKPNVADTRDGKLPLDVTGTYSCDDEGNYEIRQVGMDVTWTGKSNDDGAEWCNRFQGQIERWGDLFLIVGEWKDVPPGANQSSGTLTLAVQEDQLRVIARTGNYAGTLWKRQR